MELEELIKNHSHFNFYRQGFFYYVINVTKRSGRYTVNGNEIDEYEKYQYTIPLDEIDNGTLQNVMRSIECVRWIRKAIESNQLIKLT